MILLERFATFQKKISYEYTKVCISFDRFRDSIEMVLFDYALMAKIPLLGICCRNPIAS